MSNNPAAALRVRLVQMEVQPGQPQRNGARLLEAVATARAAGVELVVFPEMAIPGRFAGDLWRYPAFVESCIAAGEEVRQAARGITVAFGNVARPAGRAGGRPQLYNAFFIAENGRFCATAAGHGFAAANNMAPDGATPCTADAAPPPAPLRTALGAIGVIIGGAALDETRAPALCHELRSGGARLLLNPCSLPFVAGEERAGRLAALARQCGLPLCHVNAVGVQTHGKVVHVLDGGSLVCSAGGLIAPPAAPFDEALVTAEVAAAAPGAPPPPPPARVTLTAEAIMRGTGGMLRRLGLKRVVVGLSGGIDSALTALVYSRLVTPEDLLLLNLPGPFTSATTRNLARHLAAALGCRHAEVPITPAVELTRRQFDDIRLNGPGSRQGDRLPLSDYDLENVQARDRGGRVLAAAAAAFGGVISCNANKSELTIGYGTLYGDVCGWLAAIGDLWKGDVYAVARHMNERVCGRPMIPEGVFTVTPSAELSAAQAVDEGRGDPLVYPYHDKLFRAWVEDPAGVTDRDVLAWHQAGELEKRLGYEGRVDALFPDAAAFAADVARWWGLYRGLALAKRMQAPPVLAVSAAPFGLHDGAMGASRP